MGKPASAGKLLILTDLRFAAAVAGFGMLLRDSEHYWTTGNRRPQPPP